MYRGPHKERLHKDETWTYRGAQADRNDKSCLYNALGLHAAMLVVRVVGKSLAGAMQSLGSSKKVDTALSILV